MKILSLLIIIPFILVLYINIIKLKYRQINNTLNVTGFDVARTILDKNNLENIYIIEKPGVLFNLYDSNISSLKLDRDEFHSSSLNALAFAAIESVRVIMFYEDNKFIRFRNKFIKVINALVLITVIIFIFGLFSNDNSIILFGLSCLEFACLFHIFTYPIEYQTKTRALVELEKNNLISDKEVSDVKNVLNAYSFSYIASIVTLFFKNNG